MKLSANLLIVLGLATAVAAFGDDNSANPQPITSQAFVWGAGLGGMKEIQLGHLAEQKSTNTEVMAFAKRMVRDHSKLNEKLEKIAEQEGLYFPPTNTFSLQAASLNQWTNLWDQSSAGPGSENMKGAEELMVELHSPTNTDWLSIQTLEGLQGPQFDIAYANQMVVDHTKAIDTFELATNLPDKALQKFAEKTLPTLREHYRMAQDLQSRLNGTQSTNSSGM